jgi:hypothetical protein
MPYSEITGYDEITGGFVGDAADSLLAMASGDEEMGAAGNMAQAMQMYRAAQARKQQQQQHYSPRVIDVQQVSARAPRKLVIGFDSANVVPGGVAAGTDAVISVLPQVIFRGYKLVVPSDIAGSFLISDIIVGNRSQLVSAGSLPARAFQENSLENTLHLDTASVSQQLILKVTNISTNTLRFTAALFGTAAIP